MLHSFTSPWNTHLSVLQETDQLPTPPPVLTYFRNGETNTWKRRWYPYLGDFCFWILKNEQLPSDFKDSGVLNSSPFSRKMHHPWLLIAPPVSLAFFRQVSPPKMCYDVLSVLKMFPSSKNLNSKLTSITEPLSSHHNHEGEKKDWFQPHGIHGTGVFTYIYHKSMVTVGKYSSPMEHMGARWAPSRRSL